MEMVSAGFGAQRGTHPVHKLGEGPTVRYLVSSNTVEVETVNGKILSFEGPEDKAFPVFSGAYPNRNEDGAGSTLSFLSTFAPSFDLVQLSYLRIGLFEDNTPKTAGESTYEYFVFGFPTARSALPTAGSGNYRIGLLGYVMQGGSAYNLDKEGATFAVDFASGVIDTTIKLAGVLQGGTEFKDFGTITGSANLDSTSAGFTGAFSTGSSGISGGFFGPQAEEMGYAYFYDDGNVYSQGEVFGRKQ